MTSREQAEKRFRDECEHARRQMDVEIGLLTDAYMAGWDAGYSKGAEEALAKTPPNGQ